MAAQCGREAVARERRTKRGCNRALSVRGHASRHTNNVKKPAYTDLLEVGFSSKHECIARKPFLTGTEHGCAAAGLIGQAVVGGEAIHLPGEGIYLHFELRLCHPVASGVGALELHPGVQLSVP